MAARLLLLSAVAWNAALLPTTAQGTTVCSNAHHSDYECEYWAAMGECPRNRFWMIPYCRRSCFACGQYDCKNRYRDSTLCEYWAAVGECAANADWMIPNCRRACFACGHHECENTHPDELACEYWAVTSECSLNAHWMLKHCRRSCFACDLHGNELEETKQWKRKDHVTHKSNGQMPKIPNNLTDLEIPTAAPPAPVPETTGRTPNKN